MGEMNLADMVIEANNEASEKDEMRVDDIGFPLPIPDDEKSWCEYLTARLLYLNPNIYKYLGYLWIDDDAIKEDKDKFYELARFPKRITDPECRYVWSRAKELVPELKTDEISVLPKLVFNTRTGEVRRKGVTTTSQWETRL